MDNNLNSTKAELTKLGFYFLGKNTAIGSVPQKGDINGHVIQVEIQLNNYPISQPIIRLTSINGKEELYKNIPVNWRHVDEYVQSDPKESKFFLCCLHNWSAKTENNGTFIYNRILNWLESNVKQEWNQDEDLPTWRLIPQLGNSVLYLPTYFIEKVEKYKSNILYNTELFHQPFKFKNNTRASIKKRGELYQYQDIDFNEVYTFFPKVPEENKFNYLKDIILKDKFSTSTLFFIRIPRYTEFKTFYQLINYIRVNKILKSIKKEIKTVMLLVLYKGDSGRMEATAFIVGREVINGIEKSIEITSLKLENMPIRESAVNLTVGLIGVGTLGSQVARLLVEKDVKNLILSDRDKMSLENLGRHVLGSYYVGQFKVSALRFFLSSFYLNGNIYGDDDEGTAKNADILIVTVGDSQAYDKLAFQQLLNYDKPIIWAWTSSNNILQEIVITTRSTGCLNCYYRKINHDIQLKGLQEMAKKEISKQPISEFDVCGNPHTVSRMERTSFLASQIVSIISYYSKNRRFKFDYVNYYWGIDDIIPTSKIGYLERDKSCFCNQD